MTFFERIANLTKAAAHEALNKLENPVMLMNQYLRNLEEDIDSSERKLSEQHTSVKVLTFRKDEAIRSAATAEERAIEALNGGNEVAARQAVEAKLAFKTQAEEHGVTLDITRQRITELEFHIQTAKEEFARLKEKRTELVARAQRAEERSRQAQSSSSHTNWGATGAGTSGYSNLSGTAARGFERMEEKILQWEAGLNASSYNGSSASTSSPQQPSYTKNSAVEDELSRLQGKVTDTHKE
ncbi:phage shock protein A [Paenibacillus shirakamiensis]|uniref:Phage shock protein A n=1 Tax=Paenibacillus shirakamiensis TaxID=1265935 RepID=A0ABS4JIR4_9BACL|nr:PspA/IM30 family protein [Paenibacillus shirakamiensis]MBP2001583.1 phage shock protein A [Paenibacillus shirakamiensis]